jgi:hypothetical protein
MMVLTSSARSKGVDTAVWIWLPNPDCVINGTADEADVAVTRVSGSWYVLEAA